MSRKLDGIYTRATKVEDRLKSLDRTVDKENRTMGKFGTTLQATERRLASFDRQLGSTERHLRRLGTVNARPKIEIRGAAEAIRQLAEIEAAMRAMGATTARPRVNMGGAGAAGAAAGGGGVLKSLLSAGGIAGAIGLDSIITGGAGLLGAAGGAIGAGAVGASTIVPAYGSVALGGGALFAGAKPVIGGLSGGFAAQKALTDARASGDPKKIAEANKELERTMKSLSRAQREVLMGTKDLQGQYKKTFGEGARANQQLRLMSHSIDFLGKTGLPMLSRQWDRFFPVFDKNLRSVTKFFDGPAGQREFKQWTKDLPAIADNMMKAFGQSVRLVGGFMTAISPMVRQGSGTLVDWLGKKADWANSTEGIARMQTTINASRPALKEFMYGIREIGKGFVYLTENGGGRAAAGIFKAIGDHMEGFTKFLDKSTGSLPAWGHVLENVGTIIANLFGPTSSFNFMLGVMAKMTGLVASLTRGLNDLGQAAGVGGGLGNAMATGMGTYFLGKKIAGGVGGRMMGGAAAGGAVAGAGARSAAAKGLTAMAIRGGGAGALSSGLMKGAGFFGRLPGPAKLVGGALALTAAGSTLFGGAGAAPTGTEGYPATLGDADYKAMIGQGSYYERKVKTGGGSRLADAAKYGAVGATVGSIVPGAGTIAGGVVGGIAGGVAGFIAGGHEETHIQKVTTAGKRLKDVEEQITTQTKQRGQLLREILPQYDAISRRLDKTKRGEQDYNTLLSERRGLVEQIAASSPGLVEYGRGGTPIALRRGEAGAAALGSQSGTTMTKGGVAGRLRQLQAGRGAVGGARARLLRFAGGYSTTQQQALANAIDSGDHGQMVAIQRQLESAGNPGEVTKQFAAFAKVEGKHGSLKTLRDQVVELGPAFEKFFKSYKEYDSYLDKQDSKEQARQERRRQREKDAGPGGKHPRAVKPRGGKGGPFDLGGLAVPGFADGDVAADKKKGGGDVGDIKTDAPKKAKDKGKKVGEGYADGIESTAGKAKAAGIKGRQAVLGQWDQSASGPAKRRGVAMIQAYAQGILEGGNVAASAATQVYQQAVGGLSAVLPGGDPLADPLAAPSVTADPPAKTPKTKRHGGRVRGDANGARSKGKKLGEAIMAAAAGTLGGGGATPGSLAGALPAASAAAQAMGLAITSTTGGKHAKGSYHYQGRAIDVAGTPAQMARFYRYAAAKYGSGITELFYDPIGGIKHGKQVGAIGDHSDHVHLALRGGGRVHGNKKGADSVLARLAPDEFVVTPDGEAQLEEATGVRGILGMLERTQKPAFAKGGRRGSAARSIVETHGMTGTGGGDTFHFHGDMHMSSDADYEATVRRLTKDLKHQLKNLRANPEELTHG